MLNMLCCACCTVLCCAVQDGVFGAMMKVALENDGPVTFTLDSDDRGGPGGSGGSVASSLSSFQDD